MLNTIKQWIFGPVAPTSDYVRRLTLVDQFELQVNDLALYIIASVVFIDSREPISAQHVTWALRRLMAIHPLLRMRVGVLRGEWWWREMAACEPEVRVDTSRDWHDVFSQQVDERFDMERGPLWRVTLMPDVTSDYHEESAGLPHHCCLVMAFDHAIIDGTGRMKLLNELQDILATSIRCNSEHELTRALGEPVSRPMPYSYQHYVHPLTTFTERITLFLAKYPFWRTILVKLTTLTMTSQPSSVFAQAIGMENKRDPAAECKTCLYPLTIDEATTSLIRQACKRQQVSVHAAMKTAAAVAMSEMLLQAASERGIMGEELHEGVINSAAVLDRHRGDTSYVSCQLYTIPHTADIRKYGTGKHDFWALSREIMHNLQASRDKAKRQWLLNISLSVDRAARFYRVESRQPHLMGVSNLGDCNFLNRDASAAETRMRITAVFGATGEHNADPVLNNTVTSLNNKIYWAAVYFPHVTSRQFAVQFLHRSIAVLTYSCNRVLHSDNQ